MKKTWLIGIAVFAFVGWLAYVVWGLVAGFDISTRWVAFGLTILIALAMIALLILRCACAHGGRRQLGPSPGGIAAGATLGLLTIVPLGVFSFLGMQLQDPAEFARVLRRLMWTLGVLGGLVVFILIFFGIIVCLRGRHHDEDNDPLPPAPVRRKPDPWMYSQEWAKATGATVTWDNPSVTVWDPATLQEESRFDVVAGRPYKLLVEVQNGSTAAPVQEPCVGATLTAYVKEFGVGGVFETWIVPPQAPISLPPMAATGPGSVVTVEIDWTASSTGHKCLVFLIHHPDDANHGNNKGQHNLVVQPANAGQQANFAFTLWNRLPEAPEHRYPFRKGAVRRATRATLGTAAFVLSRPMLLWPSIRETNASRVRPRPPLMLGTEESVRLEVTQWSGRRVSEPDDAWSVSTSVNDVRLPLVAWDDSDAEGVVVNVEVDVPASAPSGTFRSVAVTAVTDRGRVVGGVTGLIAVQ